MGESRKEAKKINDNARKNYGWRSKIVHGSNLKKLTKEKSKEVSYETQEYNRKALLKILQNPDLIDLINSKNREDYLDRLAYED